ncbi:MAG: signal peptidase I [candidate division Zixibacteria bacterium]|nr:signal peptidase I [candidate division Zixibacteria bacterium]
MEQNFLIQDIEKAEANQQVRKVLQRKPIKPVWREYLETAAIALVAAVLLRIFVISAYRVNSDSMENSLYEGDYIFVNKLAYEYGSGPEIGDIIVFKYPNNPEKDFVKRLVALPGQTVKVVDKILYVDGQVAQIPLQSKHIDKRIIPATLSYRDNFSAYQVPAGEYFVMGDNRDDSRDSRFWGCVPKENLLGKAVFVYWSWTPDADSQDWEFPYIVDVIQWAGYRLYNLPSLVRWSRIGVSL